MDNLEIDYFAAKLSNEPYALKNWRAIYDAFELCPEEGDNLAQNKLGGMISDCQLFTTILRNWKSKIGNDASIHKFITILKDLKIEDNATPKVHQFSHKPQKFGVANQSGLLARQNVGAAKFKLSPIRYNYPSVPFSYITRKVLENEILVGLSSNENKGYRINAPIVVLYGIGGMGKTSTARKICSMATEKRMFWGPKFGGNCVWINGKDEETMFKDLSDFFGIKATNKSNFASTLKQAYSTQFKTTKCLFVFDNVTDYEALTNYLPIDEETKIVFLIISNARWETDIDWTVKNIKVEKFSKGELENYVKKALQNPSNLEIHEIEKYSGRIPYLTTIVCKGYVKWVGYYKQRNIEEYLMLLDPIATKFNRLIYCKTPQEIVELQYNLNKVNYGEWSRVALKLLRILAYSHPSLSESVIIKFSQCHPSLKSIPSNEIKDAIRILIGQGFLEKDKYGFITIHWSYQLGIQNILQQKGKEEQEIKYLLEAVCDFLVKIFANYSIVRGYAIKNRTEVLLTMATSCNFLQKLILFTQCRMTKAKFFHQIIVYRHHLSHMQTKGY